MPWAVPHPWDVDYDEARALQEELAARVVLEDEPSPPGLVTGVDVAFDKEAGQAFAAAVSFTYPALEEVERAGASVPLEFPYIPGLLSFREGPAVLAALDELSRRPDLLVLDGQGIAHPRRFGLACHIGIVTGIPAVGAAKSRYVGEHEEPGIERGSSVPLLHEGEEVGRVVRTRRAVRPLWISPGHRVSLDGAVERVLKCCTRYRLPEPTRLADHHVGRLKRERMACTRPSDQA